ncbi:sensor histidine kinase [Ottowia thiooxydans]|uniref:sensor histidine kinase n=1 Tax=Ottowia thiooxydans TaxID=219182 RepID=UPI000564A6D9|nr:HAMP domain-containing sensor histidine kinase [Ottowia thiooxydans]
MTPPRPADQSSWFNSARFPTGPTSRYAAEPDLGNPEESDFARLWRAFMTARVMIALALLGVYLVLYFTNHAAPSWLVVLSTGYLILTLAVRLLAHPRRQGRHFDAQWLYTAGADLGFFGLLYWQQIGNLNFSPLLALPVLMAAILGSRALTLGTAALATLLLLGFTVKSTASPEWNGTTEWAQTGLAGAGLLVLGWLISHLSGRLAREERLARRNRAEAREQLLVNNMVIETLSDGVLVVESNGMVRAANPAARLILDSDQEVTPPIFNLGDNPAWAQLAEIAHMSFIDRAVDSAQIVLRHADLQSSHIQVRTLLTPSMNDGRKGLCVMFLQDMREMEAQLRTEKLAAMGRMSAAVAHEIRNPLAAISQANALLEEDLEHPAQRRLSAMVRQNAQRLGNIVDDVLAIARVQHQDEDGPTPTVELNSSTEAICRDWAQQNGALEILVIQMHTPEVQVQFSREHLRRVLINLLDNALRYASRAVGAIEVKTHVVRDGPVLLAVWSDGAAMEPTVRRHLFEPFFSSESRSTGLGLFICRELCERHASLIGYERAPREREGSTAEGNEFFLSLRRAPGSLARTPVQDMP